MRPLVDNGNENALPTSMRGRALKYTHAICLVRRAVVHSFPEAVGMRGVQAIGIKTDPSATADVSAEAIDAVRDRAVDLGLREVPHRSSALINATTTVPLIVHGT
jgi:hypothetical protein